MFLLIQVVDNYQFIRGVFKSKTEAEQAIKEIEKDIIFVGNYEIHEMKMNEIVNIG